MSTWYSCNDCGNELQIPDICECRKNKVGRTKIERVDPPDGVADHLYYAGEDIDHNDLVYIGIDGAIYKVRNAIVERHTKNGTIMRIHGVDYEGIECGCCQKTFWVDTSTIPNRGCWTCPYCTGLTIDERVKDADVIKLKFSTFTRKIQDQLSDMQRAVDNLEK